MAIILKEQIFIFRYHIRYIITEHIHTYQNIIFIFHIFQIKNDLEYHYCWPKRILNYQTFKKLLIYTGPGYPIYSSIEETEQQNKKTF